MELEFFILNIGNGGMYTLSVADKPILKDGYIHLQAGENQGLSYQLRDEQLADYQAWLEMVDRNTGLIDLNEGDFVSIDTYTAAVTAEVTRLYGIEGEDAVGYDPTGYEDIILENFNVKTPVADCAKEIYDNDCSYDD